MSIQRDNVSAYADLSGFMIAAGPWVFYLAKRLRRVAGCDRVRFRRLIIDMFILDMYRLYADSKMSLVWQACVSVGVWLYFGS